jgi:hypothetical protein
MKLLITQRRPPRYLREISLIMLSAAQRAAGGQIPASGGPLPPLEALPSLITGVAQ